MNKNLKGFTFIEVVISIFLIGIFFIPAYSKIINSKKALEIAQNNTYATYFAKNILESTLNKANHHGFGEIINGFENNPTISNYFSIIENQESNDFLYSISIENIQNIKEKMIFKDNIDNYIKPISVLKTDYPTLFDVEKNKDYHVIIQSGDDVNVLKCSGTVYVENKNIIIKSNDSFEDFKIKVITNSLDNYNYIIENDLTTYLEIETDNEINNFDNIDYLGDETLICNISKPTDDLNYIITIDIFDKNSKHITKVGTLK